MSETRAAWVLKSKAAVLLALVIKRQGASLWEAVVPQLQLLMQQSPGHAETVRVAVGCSHGCHPASILAPSLRPQSLSHDSSGGVRP